MANMRNLHFNWRLMLVQIVANVLALGLTVLVLPGIRFQAERLVLALLANGFIFGLLNAFLRPILQFITFGLVLIVINFFMLRMLARLTPGWFESDSMLWTLFAAVLVGLFGVFFETRCWGCGRSGMSIDEPLRERLPVNGLIIRFGQDDIYPSVRAAVGA